MAQLPQQANHEGNNEQMDDFSAIPAGEYVGQIVKSEFKDTKAKTGKYLNLQIKILEGEYKGRIIFELLNLINPNPVAVEIANKALNSICVACGLVGVEDSDELHGIPMGLKVKINPANDNYPASNGIANYFPLEGTGAEADLPWEKGSEE